MDSDPRVKLRMADSNLDPCRLNFEGSGSSKGESGDARYGGGVRGCSPRFTRAGCLSRGAPSSYIDKALIDRSKDMG